MDHSRLYDLFDQYTSGTITATEELELASLVIDPGNEKILSELQARFWEQLKDIEDPLPAKAEKSLLAILPRVIGMRRKLFRVVAAACILVLLATGAYLFFFDPTPKQSVAPTDIVQDIKAPETNRAMITLADGRRIPVDSLTILRQNNVALIKTAEGQIIYRGNIKETIYNTLSNPRGSKVIDMMLADGSRIWLNAGSSVTYPVAFVGNERKVTVTGEAYFEIANDKTKPFYIATGDIQVKVLGTKFNVNAYDDETSTRISLLEGSVEVGNQHSRVRIKPGEQAELINACSDCSIAVNKDADMEQVMAWKNGFFNFNNSDLQQLLRQLSRWYDIEIIYQGAIPQRNFGGEMQRDLNLSEVLKILEKNNIRFTIEGRKLFIVSA